MAKASYDNITRPVRKRSAVTGMLVGVRLQASHIEAIDAWAAKQEPPVTRPEAIRGMIDAMLHILSQDPGEKPKGPTTHNRQAGGVRARKQLS